MFSRKRTYTHTGSGIPLFFKLWFAFCAILAMGFLAFAVFALYAVVTNPSAIGGFIAEIQNGYTTTVNPEPEISQ